MRDLYPADDPQRIAARVGDGFLAGMADTVIGKLGGSAGISPRLFLRKLVDVLDRVNDQLDKLDVVTDSAVSMADSADTAVRAVSTAITTPVKKVSGVASGISHGFAALRARRNVSDAVNVAKEAAARRESELDEELRAAGEQPPEAPPPAA